MSEIKRYDSPLYSFDLASQIREIPNGNFVLYKDYEYLRAQLSEAQKEAFPAYKREKALRCKAENELAEARKENDKTLQEDLDDFYESLHEDGRIDDDGGWIDTE